MKGKMDLVYYPGCTLKTKAKNLEDSAVASMAALGVRLVELSRWNCCGAVYGLAEDELLHQLAPVRNLIRAREQGFSKLVTVCSQCYHVLKRANHLMQSEPGKRKTVNSFMDNEADYRGEVEVVHLLEVLRDDVGWKNLAQVVKAPLKGLRVASYYGCTLLRPREIALDSPDTPTILDDLLTALGATPVYFPSSARCCGSYQVVADPDFTARCVREIVDSALESGAEALALSCPLCSFNLSRSQRVPSGADGRAIPVFYFTQLLAISLGLPPEISRFELNLDEPQHVLQAKGILGEVRVGKGKQEYNHEC
jgi:heterodisulfide reductase subunit B